MGHGGLDGEMIMSKFAHCSHASRLSASVWEQAQKKRLEREEYRAKKAEVLALHRDGQQPSRIAILVGVSRSFVQRVLREEVSKR